MAPVFTHEAFQKILQDLPTPILQSDTFVPRPNYPIYLGAASISRDEIQKLGKLPVAYCTYKNCSLIAGLLSFLDSMGTGVYLTDKALLIDFEKAEENLLVCLVDPHVIDKFEESFDLNRIGVLIRRKVFAMDDFRIAYSMGQEVGSVLK